MPVDIMPSGLTWDQCDRLRFCTLKGQIYTAADSDNDGLEDAIRVANDGLATPYGLHYDRTSRRLLVVAKTGLLFCTNQEDDGQDEQYFGPWSGEITVASGWGHTDDYHDWCVGSVRGEDRELFIALPCQQDQRSEAAAAYRGKVLRLALRQTTDENQAAMKWSTNR